MGRLLRAAGASSTGLMLAAACAGRSEYRGNDVHAGGAAGRGGTANNGGGAGVTGSSGASSGGSTALGGIGGGQGIIIPDASPPLGEAGVPTVDAGANLRICIVPTANGDVVTAGTGGSPPCDYSGGASGNAGSAGSGASGGGMGGVSGEAGSGEAGPPAVICPDPSQVPELAGFPCRLCHLHGMGWERVANVGTPTAVNGTCCYDLIVRETECAYVGRAFLVDDGLVRSSVREGQGWLWGPMPDLAVLSPRTREALTEAWLKDGAFEHASVATFSRFALQLLAVGAPAELLHATLAAGNDEVRHAELCFTLASAYAGKPLEPDAFPIGDTLPIQRDLCDIVAETIVEGCIGETLAAMQAQAQLAVTTDQAVLESLRSTVEDETRHAELAWRVVAWAISVGGPAVRLIAERAFAGFEPPKAPVIDLQGVDLDAFAAHGRLTPEHARAVALEALALVVRPCAAALLERDVMSHLEERAERPRVTRSALA
jgi:hypothetical protein